MNLIKVLLELSVFFYCQVGIFLLQMVGNLKEDYNFYMAIL